MWKSILCYTYIVKEYSKLWIQCGSVVDKILKSISFCRYNVEEDSELRIQCLGVFSAVNTMWKSCLCCGNNLEIAINGGCS